MPFQDFIIDITIKLVHFFIPEALAWIFIEKHNNRFKFRFSSVAGHSNLKPFAKTWLVALVILFIAVFSGDIFSLIMDQSIMEWLSSFGSQLWLLSLALMGFTFLWIYNYILEKKWDKISWSVLLLTVILTIILFF